MKELKPDWQSTKTPPEEFRTIIVRIEDDMGFVWGDIGTSNKGGFLNHGGQNYLMSDFDDWAYLELRGGK